MLGLTSSSSSSPATALSRCENQKPNTSMLNPTSSSCSFTASSPAGYSPASTRSRYENQKRRDWNTFGQYLRDHRPPLTLSRCNVAHVLKFLRYLDLFGKTKVHTQLCPFFGHPKPPATCSCPLRQAWGSLDALVGRLRAAYEENGGNPETNPFGARAVRFYLLEVRNAQAKARGISHEKKKRRLPPMLPPSPQTSSAPTPPPQTPSTPQSPSTLPPPQSPSTPLPPQSPSTSPPLQTPSAPPPPPVADDTRAF